MDDLLKKIEAFVAGPISARPDVAPTTRPDNGQGDVKDPKHDRRLKENREKEHAEITEGVRQTEEDAGEDKNEESAEAHEENDVKVPYERARTDHRASLGPAGGHDVPESGKVDALPTFPMLTKFEKNYPKPQTPVSIKPQPSDGFSPEERAIRNHPVHGPYANQALGPKPNPEALPSLYQKIKNLQSVAVGQEREELQKFACAVASLIIKSA